MNTTTTQRPTARAKLLEAAEELMLSRGFPATTVDEICEAAGASKGSFYHHFGSKEELGLAVLERFHSNAAGRLTSGPFMRLEDPRQRLLAFLDHMEEVAHEIWGRGCLLGNFAIELGETHPEIRQRVSELFHVSQERVAEIFRTVEEFADDDESVPSADEMAEQLVSLVEGAVVLGRAHGDWSPVARALKRYRRYVERLTS